MNLGNRIREIPGALNPKVKKGKNNYGWEKRYIQRRVR
jgi:hypothetical protein